MRTNLVSRNDGSIHGFEISSLWVTFGPLYRLLRSLEGVSDIKRDQFDDYRITFTLHGEPMAIWESYGDSSRYMVVPIDEYNEPNLDTLHDAFRNHQGPIAKLWSAVTGKAGK
ncbi:MAG: hypothetical protein DRJ65_02105 [Acidobacteria bacterium]|nr:MAG: hypothetical protein DRJ65_02105 [Acidobacteriota bacterium]